MCRSLHVVTQNCSNAATREKCGLPSAHWHLTLHFTLTSAYVRPLAVNMPTTIPDYDEFRDTRPRHRSRRFYLQLKQLHSDFFHSIFVVCRRLRFSTSRHPIPSDKTTAHRGQFFHLTQWRRFLLIHCAGWLTGWLDGAGAKC